MFWKFSSLLPINSNPLSAKEALLQKIVIKEVILPRMEHISFEPNLCFNYTIVIMKKFFARFLDLILPRRPRRIRTENRSLMDVPLDSANLESSGMSITTLMNYLDSHVEDLIRSLKYDGSKHAANLCAEALADFLREEIAANQQFSSRRKLIVPVPLHRTRERERGFNQVDMVLRRLPLEFRDGSTAAHAPYALSRIRETHQQTHLPRAERIRNVAGAFAVFNQDMIRGTHIFLIDDVTTTGATLANAALPLINAGATVTLIALARA